MIRKLLKMFTLVLPLMKVPLMTLIWKIYLLIYTATIDNDNPLPHWLSLDAITGEFSGRPGNNDVGLIQIKVVATDKSFTSASDSFVLTVINANDSPRVVQHIPNQFVF